jgi:L-alanine-DL-glutamate epimerase-like enolase superfamily enzyme
VKLTWRRQRLRLREPFRIARSTIAHKDVVVARLSHAGLHGYGEAVSSVYYRQPLEEIEATLGALAHDIAAYATPSDVLRGLPEIVARYPRRSFTLAGFDSAVHDWVGKSLRQPVWRLLGAESPAGRQTAISVGINPPQVIEAQARRATTEGFSVLKLKVGLPAAEEDCALVAAVRRGAPNAELYLDANGAWSADEAIRRITLLLPFGPTLVEQPIAPGQLDQLARVASSVPVPIVADEDASTADDVSRLAGVVAGVNVKLVKCGGVQPGLRMIQAARANGLRVMLGCMTASMLGIAPSVHLAALADYLDLDGHFDVLRDAWDGIGGRAAVLRPSDAPGLGVHRRRSGG